MIFKNNLARFGKLLSRFEKSLTKLQEDDELLKYELVDSRTDVPTLKVEKDGRELFLHSKYDPLRETDRLVNQMDDLSSSSHIVFYGVGLGYHIEKIMEQYQNKKFTIIEPNQEVFVRFLQSRPLNTFPFQQLFTVYVANEAMTLYEFLTSLSTELRSGGFIYILPTYERIFKEEVAEFYETYQEALKTTKSNVAAMRAFSKRWVVNSLMNVRKTIKTSNIFEKAAYFKNKPIIIAAAGPSLQEDIEKLKQIKENGSAYIFAVGSANKAFIAHNITPDAVLTYDPQPHNVSVFRELMTSGRTDIPMIYGTSVGFETIETYPGPLFHFVNSADTVTNYYLDNKSDSFDVHDSTTIALVALQIAEKLGAGPIILAGQNLAFKEERFYAKGIKHGDWEGEVREEHEGQNVVTVKDVYGNDIKSNDSLVNMRRDIETYIARRPNLTVINTTKGGANIAGAPFMPLEDVMAEKLQGRIVQPGWHEVKTEQVPDQTIKQVKRMERSIDRMYNLLDSLILKLARASELKQTTNIRQINRLFTEFDKDFNRLITSDVYKCLIGPILKIELDQLRKAITETRNETDLETRINRIEIIYGNFLKFVQEVFYEMVVHVRDVVHPNLLKDVQNKQTYWHNDGVFQYEGNWERETVTFNDLSRGETVRKLSRNISTMSAEKGAAISFRFEGTYLQLFAGVHVDFSKDVQITIDGETRTFQTNRRGVSDQLPPKFGESVFEARALPKGSHYVEIKLMTDEPLHFQGIAINEGGRVYHVDEVTRVEDLAIGKRIRCNVSEVDEEGVAKISSLGRMSTQNMELSSLDSNMDFYIEQVFEKDGKSKFISNRNLGITKAIYFNGDKHRIFKLNTVPIITSNESSFANLSCSTFYSTHNNNWDAFKLFNKRFGDTTEAWSTDRGITDGWILLELNKQIKINCYSMVSQSTSPFFNSGKRMPSHWILEGLGDNGWEQIDKRLEITNWASNEKKIFYVNCKKKYRTYRFKFLENNGDENYLSIGELELN